MKIVGVTGTNGKTTCVHLMCNLLKNYVNCASFGTLGVKQYIDNNCLSTETNLTTLGNKDLHEHLSRAIINKCDFIAMEVSSHGLDQNRVDNVNFLVAIFTNLSQDHLDYHKTMDHYFNTKVKLFTKYNQYLKYALINLDDEYGLKLIDILLNNNINNNLKIIGFSTKSKQDLNSFDVIEKVTCEQKIFTATGIQANISTPWGSGLLNTKLLGAHNLSNLLASISALMCCYSNNISLDLLLNKCVTLNPAKGRLQQIDNFVDYPRIIVDYAHTPDGLEKALQAIKQHYPKRGICCVFGCGGNRDSAKRPQMLEVADNYCDIVILTQDNSRFEDPEKIINDILSYKTSKLLVSPIIELDRKQAIYKAIKNYYGDYIIIIAGKGHETKQIIGNQEYMFCDQTVAKEALEQVINL